MKKRSNIVLKILGILLLTTFGVVGCSSGLNEQGKTTSSSLEVLEPESWIGTELPILEHIDIAEMLKEGTWLVLLYHYDCPDCIRAIAKYEQAARSLAGNEDIIRIALIAMPPYGKNPISEDCPCTVGRLAPTKDWFVAAPAFALLADGKVKAASEGRAPDLAAIIEKMI